jgi:hypothetical protein
LPNRVFAPARHTSQGAKGAESEALCPCSSETQNQAPKGSGLPKGNRSHA